MGGGGGGGDNSGVQFKKSFPPGPHLVRCFESAMPSLVLSVSYDKHVA